MNSSSSILILGHPKPQETDFGADHVSDTQGAAKAADQAPYAVLVLSLKEKDFDYPNLLKKIKSKNQNLQMILVGTHLAPPLVQKLINEVGVFKIIPNFELSNLQLTIKEALEEYELIKQNEAYLALTQEQNAKLQQLTQLLEERIKARQAYLNEARLKLDQITRRTEALNKALVAIQKTPSKIAVETLLEESLKTALQLNWIKISLIQEDLPDLITYGMEVEVLSVPLIQQGRLLGHIYFGRPRNSPFTSEEDDFLLQVSDAAALSLDRLMTFEKAEQVKQEWDSTFDSITAPVSIINDSYEILRANRTFAQKAATPLEDIVGKRCFEVFFSRSSPCPQCKLGENFELGETLSRDKTQTFFSVDSHRVQFEEGQRTFAMFYRDTSQEHRFQRQILEASKMAELGTIGSSIAHEINNPLGGMLAFLQIMKSDVSPSTPVYKDILDMEVAALKCKTIVENLLAFTRQTGSAEFNAVRAGDLFRLVINLIELQTRGLGIQLDKPIQHADTQILADANQVSQVLVNVLQNSCEALAEKLQTNSQFSPTIVLKTSLDEPRFLSIEISDNGTGIKDTDLSRVFNPFFTTKEKTKNSGLGLSVAYQIVKEHNGQMEISSVHGQTTTVVIRLPLVKPA